MPNDGPSAWDQWERTVSTEADEARDYVATVNGTFVDTTFQLTMAMQTASTEYDSIMKTEASKSFFGDIFFGIILDLLPGLKTIARFRKAVDGVELTTEAIKAIKNVEGKYEKYLDAVDIYKDVSDRYQAASSDNSQRQSGASQIQQHLNSRNNTAKEIYGKQLDLLQKVTSLADKSRKFITARKAELLDEQRNDGDLNILSRITADFKDAGLDGNDTVGISAFNNLSDKMLYEMLRNYVANYVVIYIDDTIARHTGESEVQYFADTTALRTGRLSDLPQVRTDSFIKGLDEAKRTEIYKRFPNGIGPTFNGVSSYPGVNSYKDFIKHWKPKVVSTSGRVLQFN